MAEVRLKKVGFFVLLYTNKCCFMLSFFTGITSTTAPHWPFISTLFVPRHKRVPWIEGKVLPCVCVSTSSWNYCGGVCRHTFQPELLVKSGYILCQPETPSPSNIPIESFKSICQHHLHTCTHTHPEAHKFTGCKLKDIIATPINSDNKRKRRL